MLACRLVEKSILANNFSDVTPAPDRPVGIEIAEKFTCTAEYVIAMHKGHWLALRVK